MNNQNPQMPPNQHVPDHRVDEMMERIRTLELQNTQLRTTVDFLKQVPGTQNPQAQQNPAFKPEVQEAIRNEIKQMVSPMETQYRQQLGYLADQLDQAKFQSTYGGDKYAKLLPKVEHLRQQMQAQNQYVTREQALQMVWFEETGKKGLQPDPAQVPQQQQAPQPKFDPFFGTYVDPVTGKPLQQQSFAPEEQEQQPQQMQQQFQQPPQAPQQMQWQQQQQAPQQQPVQQYQPMPQGFQPQHQQTAHPHGNAYGQQFQMPNQGVNSPHLPAHQQQNDGRRALSLESNDADLQAFEDKFGDIPL